MSMRLKDIVFLFAILVFSNILATAAGESESQPPRVQRVSREDEDSGVRRSERVLSDRTERRRGASQTLSRNSPAFLSRIFNQPSAAALQLSSESNRVAAAVQQLDQTRRRRVKGRRLSARGRKAKSFASSQKKSPATVISSVFQDFNCNPSYKYRTFDGTCNNLNFPAFGKAVRAFNRLLEPDYDNGVDSPRRNFYGSPLPSARCVSAETTSLRNRPERKFTMMLMQWGQFLDHDITHTPVQTGGNSQIACCKNGKDFPSDPSQPSHSACLPIEVPAGDKFYSKFNVTCMEFVRSLPAVSSHEYKGYREQINQITAFIDASNVYGSDDNTARNLREHYGGRLRVSIRGGRSLLPADSKRSSCIFSAQRPCFKSGDSRTNEQPNLAVMHTIWVREHNRIASALADLNPNWDDEKLFQEARRIVAAEMQHITYNEWLPIILGSQFTKHYQLAPLETGYSKSYDDLVDPTIVNSFATAAFRFGHSLIRGKIKVFSSRNQLEKKVALSDNFFKTDLLYEKSSISKLILGLTWQTSQDFDNQFTSQVRNKLFAGENGLGLDLVALNIQRGRDHGLPSYVEFRNFCDLDLVTCFDDLEKDLGYENVARLKNVYDSVDDIDLFIGGVMERKAEGAMVGRTFQCILGEQFKRLKVGDRFFYEFGDSEATRFTAEQLQEIRKASLARVVCDNTGAIELMQPNVFLEKEGSNALQKCCDYSAIPYVDLTAW